MKWLYIAIILIFGCFCWAIAQSKVDSPQQSFVNYTISATDGHAFVVDQRTGAIYICYYDREEYIIRDIGNMENVEERSFR